MRNILALSSVLLLFLSACGSLAAPVVKLSRSGICHSTESPWYGKTRNFTAFDSMEDCFGAGGRAPKGFTPTALTVRPGTAYDRERDFGSWIDADGDCLNTRHEILAQLSTGPVRMSANGCLVLHGRWNDPYTGRIFTESRDVDIDHMVPLKWAWDHGADKWPAPRRQEFANDPRNLFVVEAATNREKGADGPLRWLPPNTGYRCEYLLRFKRIILTYDLSLSPGEEGRMEKLRHKVCD